VRPLREDDPERERGSIELSDEALLARFVYRKPPNINEPMSESLRKKLVIAEELCKETIRLEPGQGNAKDTSKVAPRKAKAANLKPHKAAVASVEA